MRSAALLLCALHAAATRVTKDQWQAEAQNALEAAKPLWFQASNGCVLTISGNRVTTTSDSPLKLCRVKEKPGFLANLAGNRLLWRFMLIARIGDFSSWEGPAPPR